MHHRWITFVASALLLGLLGAATANADALQDIKKKGVLVVGTKGDYRPFGYLDPAGKIIGFEPDLAADVAKRLRGEAQQLYRARQQVLEGAFASYPRRFKNGLPHPPELPTQVGINWPKPSEEANTTPCNTQ